jgi:hypothetical protein
LVGGSPLLRPAAPMAAGKPRKKETYMSKNLTRKGFALAAVVALGSTLFAGAPATANASGPLTLLPNGGTATGATYTSLIGSGITLTSSLDADKQSAARNTDTSGTTVVFDSGPDNRWEYLNGVAYTGSVTFIPAVDPLNNAYYLIENPAGATIKLTLGSTIQGGGDFYWYDADGVPTGRTTDYLTSPAAGFIDITGSNSYVTSAKQIAVRSTVNGGSAGARSVSNITIDVNDANATSAVKLKVTSWADSVNSDGKISNGEHKSATQEVNLLPASAVAVTTSVHSSTVRGATGLNARVSLGSSVNPHAVVAAGQLGVVFYEDGAEVDINDNGSTDVVSGELEYRNTASVSSGVIVVSATRQGGNLISAGYSARSVYLATNPDIFVGPRSVVLDLRNGTNTTVTGADATFTKSNDVLVSSSNAVVRAGTKTVPVVGQILKDGNATVLASAGVRVSATIVGHTVDATSEITVSGSTAKIVEADDTITVFGFTDAKGQFPLTITSTTGKATDRVDVTFRALNTSGVFVNAGGATRSVTWQTAALQQALLVSPSEYLTGANVNVTFTAVDQFGVGMDQNTVGRISIRVDAFVDGAVKSATYSETKPTTAGAASFSFANFATAGSNQEIRVQTLAGSTTPFTAYYTVYNNVATTSIAVADTFENRVQYVDYVTGKTTDAAVLKAATDAGVIAAFTSNGAAGQYATIAGTTLDANNAGQPGAAVTIAAAGVLFHDAETSTIAKDSITVFANGQGFFDVQALSQKVNAAGATVTITAGGVSKTTLLRTYLPTSISAANLKFSWVLPATIVKDTTYSVTATLTDVWGNPIRTLDTAGDMLVYGEGSLLVNGEGEINRNFNVNGTSTFFIRSVATIGGPGTLGAVLDASVLYGTGKAAETGTVTDADQTFTTNVATTSWNETLWSGSLAVTVDVLDRAPAAAGTVNVGSFNGKLVVYAKDLAGARISWKVGGNWGTAIAQGNTLNRFDRPTPRAGVTVSVEIYVNGVKQLTKSVVTR